MNDHDDWDEDEDDGPNFNCWHESETKPEGDEPVQADAPSLLDYDDLSPDFIGDALESLGLQLDSGLLALNSYENRVYQFRADDGARYVTKFYRPRRWSDAQIREEHDFTWELADAELPVSPPLRFNGETLLHYGSHRFSVFASQGGRAPELDNTEHLTQLGRLLARIHLVGERASFVHRPAVNTQSFGHEALQLIESQGHVPSYLRDSVHELALALIGHCDAIWQALEPVQTLRLHGDCHPGNVLWHNHAPHFVDFDDSRSGPAMQDLWMLLSGSALEMKMQFAAVMEGYEEFREFNYRERHLVEVLRALRQIHYSGWLSARWSDPAFPRAFPWFGLPRYWEELSHSWHEQRIVLERIRESL